MEHSRRTRPVTADHIIFTEVIDEFRLENPRDLNNDQPLEEDASLLFLSFELPAPLETDSFHITSSNRIDLPGSYVSYISEARYKKKSLYQHAHLYATGISALLTFVSQRPTKATKDSFWLKTIDKDSYNENAIHFPVLSSGPGAVYAHLSQASFEKIRDELRQLDEIIHNISYKDYRTFFQAIRLVHLAHLNKREDFALGYSLLIAAIEAVSQLAIKRDQVKDKKAESNKLWEELAKNDESVKELLAAYNKARGENQYLSRRFIKFITDYCPIGKWDGLPNPMENMKQHLQEQTERDVYVPTEKGWYEKYPSDLAEEEITKMLLEAYKHRSNFVHRGESPPHRNQVSLNRYFEIIEEYNIETKERTEIILPNFELMSFIAKESITAYYKSKLKVKE